MKNKRSDNISKGDVGKFYNGDEFVFAFNWIHNNGFLEELSEDEIKANLKNVFKQILARLVMYIPDFNEDLVERMLKVYRYPNKTENEEYFRLAYGDIHGKKKLEDKSNRVKGKNNPAHGHGGKYSPFSDKFIKYQNGENRSREVVEKAMKTKTEHPERQPTKIEYYLAQGMSEEEAKEALSERQKTFSLERCIEKHGVEKGTKVWQQRQAKWRESLGSMSDDELFYFVRSQCRGAYTNTVNAGLTDGYLYLFRLEKDGEKFLKVGFSHDYNKRIRALRRTGNSVTELCKIYGSLSDMFEFEDVVLESQKENLVYRDKKLKEKVDHPFETMRWSKKLESELLATFAEALKLTDENSDGTT